MPDHTQTLSVEPVVREAMVLGFCMGALPSAPDPYPKDSEVVDRVVRAAESHGDLYPNLARLSQPEHQGDDDEANSRWVELEVIRGRPHTQFSRVGPIVAAEGAIYPEGNWERCLYVPKHKAREHAEAIAEERNVAQLSAPVLSDQEREQVPKAAHDAAYRAVRATAKRRNQHAPEPDSVSLSQFARAAVDAALPYLPAVLSADEARRLENIATLIEAAPGGDQDASKETAAFLRNLASREHRGEANEELTMIALALYNQGIEDCTPERGVELLIERLYAQRKEAVSFDLLLADTRLHAHIAERCGLSDLAVEEVLREVVAATQLAATQPPAGEGGEKKRRCPDDGACHHACRPGECWRVHNAAPLSEYGEAWPPAVVSASATRSLPGAEQPEGGDQEKCPRCDNPGTPWGDTREGTAWNCEHCGLPFQVIDSGAPRHVVDTPSARAAGDDPDTARQEAEEPEGDECPKSPDGCHDFEDHGGGAVRCMHCGRPGPERGDEEDWHEVWVWRDSITGKLRATTGSTELSSVPPCSAVREASRRYAPATSQDSSGLQVQLERALDLAERAANQSIARTLQRDEAWAALNDLAEEFEQLAEIQHKEAARGDASQAERQRYEARSATLEKAAALAREKAAELKGDRDAD